MGIENVVYFEHVRDECPSDTGYVLEITSYYEARVLDPETAMLDLKLARPDLLRYNGHPLNGRGNQHDIWSLNWQANGREDDPCMFDIQVDYSNYEGGSSENRPPTEQAQLRIRTPTVRTIYKDELITKSPNTGQPFLNTAGDLVTGVREEIAFGSFEYEMTALHRPKWTWDYRGAINSDEIKLDGQVFKKFQLAVGELTVAPERDDTGMEYRVIRLQLIAHPFESGWLREFPNVGFYELGRAPVFPGAISATVKARVRIKDEDDEPIEKPWWLDADGKAIRREAAAGQNPSSAPFKVPMDPADFIWLKIDTRKQLPFKIMNLV